MSKAEFDLFFNAYVEAIAFTESEGYENFHLTEEAVDEALVDCATFLRDNRVFLQEASEKFGYTYTQAGHDFWLTRNGHGAGFWDRGIEEAGERLTEAARSYPEADVYIDVETHEASYE